MNGQRTLAVLMYHSVATDPGAVPAALSVPAATLREQLHALRSAGYALMGVSQALAAKKRDPASTVVGLSFDDGFVDFATDALAVLAETEATATLYQAVGYTGRPATWLAARPGTTLPRVLTWRQLREVSDAGIEIGNHSLIHHPLDVLPRGQLDVEVRVSRQALEQELGVPVTSFAYPHGYQNRAVRHSVAESGHTNACVVGRRRHRLGDDLLAVPRLHITGAHTGADVLSLVRGGGPRLEPVLKGLATPGWRAARRIAYAFGRTWS